MGWNSSARRAQPKQPDCLGQSCVKVCQPCASEQTTRNASLMRVCQTERMAHVQTRDCEIPE